MVLLPNGGGSGSGWWTCLVIDKMDVYHSPLDIQEKKKVLCQLLKGN